MNARAHTGAAVAADTMKMKGKEKALKQNVLYSAECSVTFIDYLCTFL